MKNKLHITYRDQYMIISRKKMYHHCSPNKVGVETLITPKKKFRSTLHTISNNLYFMSYIITKTVILPKYIYHFNC
jgi:hypothetical protein